MVELRLGLSQVTCEMDIIIKFFKNAVNEQVRETIGSRDSERLGEQSHYGVWVLLYGTRRFLGRSV